MSSSKLDISSDILNSPFYIAYRTMRKKSKSSRLFMEYNGLSSPDVNPYICSRDRIGLWFTKYGNSEYRKGLPVINAKTSIKTTSSEPASSQEAE